MASVVSLLHGEYVVLLPLPSSHVQHVHRRLLGMWVCLHLLQTRVVLHTSAAHLRYLLRHDAEVLGHRCTVLLGPHLWDVWPVLQPHPRGAAGGRRRQELIEWGMRREQEGAGGAGGSKRGAGGGGMSREREQGEWRGAVMRRMTNEEAGWPSQDHFQAPLNWNLIGWHQYRLRHCITSLSIVTEQYCI